MSEKPVTSSDLEKLRQSGLITEQEVALIAGDVILAENVVTKERRIASRKVRTGVVCNFIWGSPDSDGWVCGCFKRTKSRLDACTWRSI